MMGYFFPFILFILGLCVGSFINVVIERLPKGESIIKKRSHCPSCKKSLKWYDMIPVLSFVLLKGKCRYCRSPISLQYPLVELFTGFLFIATFFYITEARSMNYESGIMNFITTGFYLFIASSLLAIFFIDIKCGIIPNKIIFPSILVSFAYLFLIHNSLFMIHFFSAIGALLFLLLIFLATRGRGMGFGDVKLSFLIGLIVGFPGVVIAIYSAFLTGAVVSVILILLGKKKFKGGTIPFGPFLVLGTFIALFLGELILKNIPYF